MRLLFANGLITKKKKKQSTELNRRIATTEGLQTRRTRLCNCPVLSGTKEYTLQRVGVKYFASENYFNEP